MVVTLPPQLEQLVQDQVASGRYGSASEVVGEALRLFQEREELQQRRFEELKREIAIGIAQADQGQLIPAEEVFRELREQQARFENLSSK
jgi:antitoxin ParD1/3/4